MKPVSFWFSAFLCMTSVLSAKVQTQTKKNYKPSKAPVYKYPSTAPVYKYSSSAPVYKYPTVKPIYKYPTLKPIHKCPTNTPSSAPTLEPTNEPSSTPSAPKKGCTCNKYSIAGTEPSPNVVLCYNNTKPTEYFGVYDATGATPVFGTNLIEPNLNFPLTTNFPAGSGRCSGASYDNARPVTNHGVGYVIGSNSYVIFLGSPDPNLQGFFCNGVGSPALATDLGPVNCPLN